ncbi:carbohydrate kinase family protein [Candidatus Harpocratesius sp.]
MIKNRLDIVFIGHFAFDFISHNHQNHYNHHSNTSNSNEKLKRSLGGGVTYGSLAAVYYNPNSQIAIISKVGKDFDRSLLLPFKSKGIDISGIQIQQGTFTTSYELKYEGSTRKLRLRHKAPKITIKDFPQSIFDARAIHLTPIAGEISLKTLEIIANHKQLQKTIIGLDIQGIIRDFDENGYVISKDCYSVYEKLEPILKLLKDRFILKASGEEAMYLTQESSVQNATQKLANLGIHVFTTLGEEGFIYKHADNPMISFGAYRPTNCVDETGAGDCFMAVLLSEIVNFYSNDYNLTHETMLQCAKIASAASSFLIEQPGPAGFKDRDMVLNRMKEQQDISSNPQIFKIEKD